MGNRLYVGNLPYSVTELDLRDLFAPMGTVTEAKIVTDRETGRPRGFGFVEMSNEAEAKKAITELDGRDVQGRPVAVKEAEERRGGGGGGGGGGQHCFFCDDGPGNGGGGGGAGGCGAGGGTSGAGGGGSFAVFVSASVVTVDANYLVVSQAGAGGLGGNGATGGAGGNLGAGGTVCTGQVGGGGNGSGGGKGGNSGAGAGGPGGPGVAIFGTSGSVTIGTNRYSLPGTAPAGSGGTGGSGGLVGVVRHGYPNDFADPGPAMLAIADASILMSYTGTNFINVPVSLGPITNTYVTVHYQTADGTAIAGTNYTATSGDLSFAPWATAQTIRVPVLGVVSPSKTFSIQLSSSINAGITTSSDTVTINYFSDIIFRNSFD
jgi:RNA recognition motif/Calx-beta domain